MTACGRYLPLPYQIIIKKGKFSRFHDQRLQSKPGSMGQENTSVLRFNIERRGEDEIKLNSLMRCLSPENLSLIIIRGGRRREEGAPIMASASRRRNKEYKEEARSQR